MKFLPKLVLVAALASPFSAMADAKMDSVYELMDVMEIEKQMTGGFDAMMPMLDQIAQGLQLNADEKQELTKIYKDWFFNDIDHDSITKQAAQLYADSFSKAEIDALIDFYSSEAGQKFIELAPELMQAGARIGMEEAQKSQAKLMERLQPFMEKHQPSN